MKWQIVLSTPRQEVYVLSNKERKLLTLDFHPTTNSARIEYADEKRVFLVRKEGFLKNKTVLCNEYGIRLGQLVHENKENFIELNNERFYYDIQDNPRAEVVIYKESKKNPLVVCELNINKANISLETTKDKILPVNALSSLLLALCWYILLPVAKKNTVEYAA
jgi:hypothetical protein